MFIPFWAIYLISTIVIAVAICTIGYGIDVIIERKRIKKKMKQTAQWLGSWGP